MRVAAYMMGSGLPDGHELRVGSAKAAANREKHGVSFDEALTVFRDRRARIFDDPDRSGTEVREIIVGHSARQAPGRLLRRTRQQGADLRIFSARKATRRERKDYENRE
jgi:hypothetical protein